MMVLKKKLLAPIANGQLGLQVFKTSFKIDLTEYNIYILLDSISELKYQLNLFYFFIAFLRTTLTRIPGRFAFFYIIIF